MPSVPHTPSSPTPAAQRPGADARAPDSAGGWDAQSPLAAMPIQNAVILDNWIPRAGFVEIRRGFVPQQTGTPGPVEIA